MLFVFRIWERLPPPQCDVIELIHSFVLGNVDECMIMICVAQYQFIDSCPRLPASGWSLPPSSDSFRFHPCLFRAAPWRLPRGRAMGPNLLHSRHQRTSPVGCQSRAKHLDRRMLSRRNSGWQKQNIGTSSLRLYNRGTRALLSRTTRRNPGRSRNQLCGAGQAGTNGRPHVWKRNTGARSSDCCRTMQSCTKQP